MQLETERLIIRRWKQEDAQDLFNLAKDNDIGTAAGWHPHKDIEETKKVLQESITLENDFAVELKSSHELVGNIELMIGKSSNLEITDKEGEIGYWLGKPYWGKRLIPEALVAVIDYGFDVLNLENLWCAYFEGNEKSRKVMENCGFVFHHTEKDKLWKLTGEVKTEHVTRMTRQQWLLQKENRG